MNNSKILLTAEDISKRYNGCLLLREISLSISKGEAICIVGKNGSGKSTLLRILSGLTSFDSGRLIIDKRISKSFIPDGFEKSNMTIKKFMKYIYDMDEYSTDSHILNEYYEKYSIMDMIDTPMKFLSKGSLQKVAVIQALISERNLIFMDEPLDGQDTTSKSIFFEEIKERKRKGVGVIIACHEKQLMDELGDKIYCLEKGVLVNCHRYINVGDVNKSLFILYGNKELGIISDVKKLLPDECNIKVTYVEDKIRIEIDIAYAEIIFRYIIHKGVKISKYEEFVDDVNEYL